MRVSEAIAARKSVRAYLDKPVRSEDVEKIVEAGRWAPNAGPFHIAVVSNPELRKKINDRTYEAMVRLLFFSMEREKMWPKKRITYARHH